MTSVRTPPPACFWRNQMCSAIAPPNVPPPTMMTSNGRPPLHCHALTSVMSLQMYRPCTSFVNDVLSAVLVIAAPPVDHCLSQFVVLVQRQRIELTCPEARSLPWQVMPKGYVPIRDLLPATPFETCDGPRPTGPASRAIQVPRRGHRSQRPAPASLAARHRVAGVKTPTAHAWPTLVVQSSRDRSPQEVIVRTPAAGHGTTLPWTYPRLKSSAEGRDPGKRGGPGAERLLPCDDPIEL